MHTTIIGIDPGKSGGIAMWDLGSQVVTCKMPEEDRLVELLRHWCFGHETHVFIEQIPKFAGTRQFAQRNIFGASIATLYGNYKLCVGICLGLGLRPVCVVPLKWQNIVECRNFDRLEKGPWKNRLKDRAIRLFPDVRVTLATADALLIAFAGRKILGL